MSDRAQIPGSYDTDLARDPWEEDPGWGEIQSLGKRWPNDVSAAVDAVGQAHSTLRELLSLYDIELAEGPEGPDANEALLSALSALRNVERIARGRLRIFGGLSSGGITSRHRLRTAEAAQDGALGLRSVWLVRGAGTEPAVLPEMRPGRQSCA
jgi:hypothetical protein